MGLYETTILYHGRPLSPVGFQRLTGHKTTGFITAVCKDRWILHPPGKHIVVGSMDAVMKRHEKESGRILQSEVDKLLSQVSRKHPEKVDEWRSVTDEQMEHLNQLVKIAAADDSAEPGTYMCEVAWSTLEPTANASLTYNLKVI